MNIAPLDWAVLVLYLVIITAIGLFVGYRVRQSGEYFLGGRKFGPWLMIGQSFGVGTHAEMPVALAGAVYTLGASAIWLHPHRGAAGRGWQAYRDDLGGFALGWALCVALVIATALFLAL